VRRGERLKHLNQNGKAGRLLKFKSQTVKGQQLPEYCRKTIDGHTRNKVSRYLWVVDTRVSRPQGKQNYLEGMGIWKANAASRKEATGRIGVLPYVERRLTSRRCPMINQSKGIEPHVKDRVNNDIGAREPLENWADIGSPNSKVRNLRQRIYQQLRMVSGIRLVAWLNWWLRVTQSAA